MPPIVPDPLAMNFNEEDFCKGEKEYRAKLLQCMLDISRYNDKNNIYNNFYYDANIKD